MDDRIDVPLVFEFDPSTIVPSTEEKVEDEKKKTKRKAKKITN